VFDRLTSRAQRGHLEKRAAVDTRLADPSRFGGQSDWIEFAILAGGLEEHNELGRDR
jgi:hypothetical protein